MAKKQVPVRYLRLYTDVVTLASRLEGFDSLNRIPFEYVISSLPNRRKIEERLLKAIERYQEMVPSDVKEVFNLDIKGLESIANRGTMIELGVYKSLFKLASESS